MTHFVTTVIVPIVVTLLVILIIIFLLRYIVKNTRCSTFGNFNHLHVLITGGSSGIGKALALKLAKCGASVTLVARNKNRLKETAELVEKNFNNDSEQKPLSDSPSQVEVISADLCGDLKHLHEEIQRVEKKIKPIDILFNCAGYSLCGTFRDMEQDAFKEMMDVNYLGSVAITKCVVDGMVERKKGHIVFVSSIAGQFGLYGYSAYAPSKFAVRGLAETLSAELSPHGVAVSVAYPPDTDTPGFEEENKQKPEITKIISSSSSLFTSSQVADMILNGVKQNQFNITCGFDGYIIGLLASACSPAASALSLMLQVIILGPVRIVWSFYLYTFASVATKYINQNVKQKKVE